MNLCDVTVVYLCKSPLLCLWSVKHQLASQRQHPSIYMQSILADIPLYVWDELFVFVLLMQTYAGV